eukprot:TRINITY_DN104958_c0_g1_i1.p1 TRINITY_DN104958_c0_g1~~TRINITY_DN104958_c0_g1_i1.p1  ORF type:complete len:560 (+),score=87.48 TRINITY_DN104958_c0_g1_i1:73-1752(+)
MSTGFVPMGGQSRFQVPPRGGAGEYCSAPFPRHDQSQGFGSPVHQQSPFGSVTSCGGSPHAASGYGDCSSRPLKIAELEQGVPPVVWARTLPSTQSQASQQLIEQLRTTTANTEALRQDAARLVSELQAPRASPCVAHQLRPPLSRCGEAPSVPQHIQSMGERSELLRLEPPRPSSTMRSPQPSAIKPEQPLPHGAEGGNFVLPRRQHCLNEVKPPQWSSSASVSSTSDPNADGRLQLTQGSTFGSNFSTSLPNEPEQTGEHAQPTQWSNSESIYSTILPSNPQQPGEQMQQSQRSSSSSIFATILPSRWQQTDESAHSPQRSWPSQCKQPDAEDDEDWRPGVMKSWRPQQKAPDRPVDSPSFIQGPAASMVGHSLPEVQRCLLVRLGILEFDSYGALGTPGLFETTGFRILLQTGARSPMMWTEGLPATERKELKYSRDVSSDGRYSARLSCEFNEDLEVLVPSEGPLPELLCADVWYERRTVVEQFDSILNFVGLGNDLPEFEKVFLGRISAGVPPEDGESLAQSYPVLVGKSCEGPRPKAMTLSLEWATQPTQPPQ